MWFVPILFYLGMCRPTLCARAWALLFQQQCLAHFGFYMIRSQRKWWCVCSCLQFFIPPLLLIGSPCFSPVHMTVDSKGNPLFNTVYSCPSLVNRRHPQNLRTLKAYSLVQLHSPTCSVVPQTQKLRSPGGSPGLSINLNNTHTRTHARTHTHIHIHIQTNP